jgi:hypothetical protein
VVDSITVACLSSTQGYSQKAGQKPRRESYGSELRLLGTFRAQIPAPLPQDRPIPYDFEFVTRRVR